ncbi:MAG: hypothetical protein WBD22_03000 [Pyrinomonadaceae bacterium]
MQRIPFVLVLISCLISASFGQKAEVTVSLNEQFFEALLDSVYQNSAPPEFSISSLEQRPEQAASALPVAYSFFPSKPCSETIKILREGSGVRTTVRFRDGRINAPLAFSGNYSPPFLGCVEFAGYADTNIELVFDRESQRLIGRAAVSNVALDGTGGLGSSVIARLVQGSLDKKINPIEIIRLDKLAFAIPVQSSGNVLMKAQSIRPEIGNGVLNIHIAYEFSR